MSSVPKVHRHLPLSKVRFQNIEDPGQDMDCSWGPDTKHIGTYHFENGKIYDVPTEYVEFLNTRDTKVYGEEVDPQSGLMKTVLKGTKNRFSFLPVAMKKKVKPNFSPAPKPVEV